MRGRVKLARPIYRLAARANVFEDGVRCIVRLTDLVGIEAAGSVLGVEGKTISNWFRGSYVPGDQVRRLARLLLPVIEEDPTRWIRLAVEPEDLLLIVRTSPESRTMPNTPSESPNKSKDSASKSSDSESDTAFVRPEDRFPGWTAPSLDDDQNGTVKRRRRTRGPGKRMRRRRVRRDAATDTGVGAGLAGMGAGT